MLVTGATYFLGAHVVRALARRDRTVRCLPASAAGAGPPAGTAPGAWTRRSAVAAAAGSAELEWIDAGLHDADALEEAVRGCRVVYHCDEDYRGWIPEPETIYRHNVAGTRRVLAAAAEGDVDRVVHTSSVGCLGRPPPDGPADEETPVRPEELVGHYQRSKYRAERVVDEWHARGLPVVVVNPPASVGELDFRPTPVGQLVIEYLSGNVPAYTDTGRNFVDARAVATGHLLAAERGTPGRRYILGGRNLTVGEFLRLLSGITGQRAVRLQLPKWMATAGAVVSEVRARLAGGRPRVSLEEVRVARQKLFFDASRAERELGWKASPLEPALERAVRWFRERGYLSPEDGA